MMVIFVSQCEKKALIRTRQILDAFANRIGERTWQTIITEDGLITVKKLLRQAATKNTAVACHWMRSRIRDEVVWIVGNRQKFNMQGIVPVNSTKKNYKHREWENDWQYLPIIKALVAVAALLHDWGKASVLFQKKLAQGSKNKDPLRHEWVSCLLLNALIRLSGNSKEDEAWLTIFINGDFNEEKLIDVVNENLQKPLENLPPLAQWVAWLIVTHHRLPGLNNQERDGWSDQEMNTMENMLRHITAKWGYQNNNETDYQSRLKDCFRFEHGLLSESIPWCKSIKKWAGRLLAAQPQVQTLIDSGAWRVILHHARLCLMLGDHYYSSCKADQTWQNSIPLYANTQIKDNKRTLKQRLDEHLVRVSEQSLKVSQSLSRFTTDMEMAQDIRFLKQKSPKGYEWQDLAVDKIKSFKSQNGITADKNYGWFLVNMASTGCGKTLANAKIMQALSDDNKSLRYILALGLRTLTLQTGEEYRNRIGLEDDELAVLIGSSAIQELYQQAKRMEEEPVNEELGSESLEQLLDEELEYNSAPSADFLEAIIPKHNPDQAKKNKAFLYKPILTCTIDHIIAATETTRGGKYILPSLRLLSSDLVIDEVDDFDGKDLIAIGRLIHLAGMLGRKVMISSATIPPALAEGFLNAYQEGWRLHASFKNVSPQIACVWVDEFSTQVNLIDKTESSQICQQYADFHEQFIVKRVEKLKRQIIKRKAYIVRCDDIFEALETTETNELSRQEKYFEKMAQTAIDLHHHHHLVDESTGKKVSFGVMRMANVPPCIQLSQYLISKEWRRDITVKVMAYHSRQVLLLRHEQEKHLDEVLKRIEKINNMPQALDHIIIRNHLDNTEAENVLFILVTSPIEEVGRNHDFDWAVIEPSSYRSIIQLAGRVRRHRHTGIEQSNIAIMQYNLKALRKNHELVYRQPGYETVESYRLITHDLCLLVDESILNHAIDAIPRISTPKILNFDKCLVDLEHKVIGDVLTYYKVSTKKGELKGPKCLRGWFIEYWWLTAVPQQLNRFREGPVETQLYLVWQKDKGKSSFCERSEQGEFIPREFRWDIKKANCIDENMRQHLWLDRNYEAVLRSHSKVNVLGSEDLELEDEMRRVSQRYGELTIPDNENQSFIYSDQFGLLKVN